MAYLSLVSSQQHSTEPMGCNISISVHRFQLWVVKNPQVRPWESQNLDSRAPLWPMLLRHFDCETTALQGCLQYVKESKLEERLEVIVFYVA